ncbi:hypothetical protein M441DRAFT_56599 [Trichoderma asperellum CBS 433.97]|uniref:Uncharacterized protein n=1 Tax=Trichoderma asperellum (strain ATCC 204424 / CBS 433.97 / NBRC 101777) TaxID=1042311 RepID=A0A2T3ZFL7_TRIA4|nr:hypothetical protein M441DRAFT_56599 [Trichoderma asperellum CBS 433.97]PTB43607.1 hypothetical protein M441DRAFT_56599 [Trichoderma asperellum CBS 433.97]
MQAREEATAIVMRKFAGSETGYFRSILLLFCFFSHWVCHKNQTAALGNFGITPQMAAEKKKKKERIERMVQ